MSTWTEQRERLTGALTDVANLSLQVRDALPGAPETPDNAAALAEAQECVEVINGLWLRLLRQLGATPLQTPRTDSAAASRPST